MGDDRKSEAVTELTPREILDAIDRALEKAARQFAKDKPEAGDRPSESDKPVSTSRERGIQVQRQER
jgi:hypothetical protein